MTFHKVTPIMTKVIREKVSCCARWPFPDEFMAARTFGLWLLGEVAQALRDLCGNYGQCDGKTRGQGRILASHTVTLGTPCVGLSLGSKPSPMFSDFALHSCSGGQ